MPAQNRYRAYFTGRSLQSNEQYWGNLHFTHNSTCLRSGAERLAFRKNHKLFAIIGGGTSRTVVKVDGANRYDGHNVVGHVSFVPAERLHQAWYEGDTLECLALEIPPEWISKCLDGQNASSVEFLPRTSCFDPLMFKTMAALQEEAETAGPAGRLFSETAATLIALHLIRSYSSLGNRWAPAASREIAATDLRETLEFMEENLGGDLTLDALSKVAKMPISVLVRNFRAATKMSPHRYLTHRRIERSQQLLRFSNLPIAEVAYRLGFSSQSHFSTVFRSCVGEPPARFREHFRRK